MPAPPHPAHTGQLEPFSGRPAHLPITLVSRLPSRRPAGPPGQSGTRLPSTAVSSSRMGRPAWWLSRQGCPSKRSWLGSASDTASMGLLWTSSWWAGTR